MILHTPDTPHGDTPTEDTATGTRQRWMGVLAKASPDALETAWQRLSERPAYTFLRRPETGSALVRARAGGTGARFNLGETTLTRCAVALPGGITGFGYVQGRNKRHAELAAVFDALLQTPAHHDTIAAEVVTPLAHEQAARKVEQGRKAASSRVDFFTMVRGDD